jgi:hypothetical protein
VLEYVVARTAARAEELLLETDAAWTRAEAVAWGPEPWVTRFRALATPDHLCLRFDVADRRPWHTMTVRDDRLWNEEVVEIFLDPDRAGHDYAELEISPANVVCDLVVERPWPTLRSDPSWHIGGLATRVVPCRDAGCGPDGWTALAALPWRSLRSLPVTAALPPRPGDAWRFNLYRIKRPHGPANPDADVVYAAWSPTGGPSFHVPAAFAELRFA